MKQIVALVAALPFLLGGAAWSQPTSPEQALKRFDRNGDGLIDREEFSGPVQVFRKLDKNRDGSLDLSELSKAPVFSGGSAAGAAPRSTSAADLDEVTCAFARGPRCGSKAAEARGMIETGLTAVFPKGARCNEIDDTWAMDYSHKRQASDARHGGIDMPAPFGTPILAAADGKVVAKFLGEGRRGTEIILQHSPRQTGLPFWTYTQYAHFDAMPEVRIGQTVRMGQFLGPTGNSGRGSEQRRPAIHFAVMYSASSQFALGETLLIPEDGFWMDPIAFYRTSRPYDSASLRSLPKGGKSVPIPVAFGDGSVSSEGTLRIWPYACQR